MNFAAATALALTAAVAFAAASVVEQRSTKQVPQRGVSPRLLVDLAMRPLWLAAIGVNIVGSVLQVLALHFGPLALVQPVLVCNLLFAVVIAALIRHRRPDRILSAGVVCCAVGIASFVAVGRPAGGRNTVTFASFLPLVAALAAVLAGCLAAVRWGPRRSRGLMLALACGADFGVTAFLLKLVSHSLAHGLAAPLQDWPLYAVAFIGPAGFLLNQSAFQAGALLAPVLAVITTIDPLVSIGIAHVWLNETINGSPPAIAAEVVSLAVMTGGIIALAHRAPQIERQRLWADHRSLPGPGPSGSSLPRCSPADSPSPGGCAAPGPPAPDSSAPC